MRNRCLAALSGLLVLGLAVSAQERREGNAQRADDRTFIQSAASGGLKEVRLGQLAQSQGGSAEVKSFGKHMVEDHTKANDEFAALLKKKGMEVPKAMTEKHQAVVDRLSKLNAEQFDSEYMKHMVESHKEAIALFETQAQGGQDPDIKAFATKTLPTLKKHLEMAQKHGGKKQDH